MPSEIELTGTITIGTSEEAAYAEVLDKLEENNEAISNLEENAVMLNGEFDDTAGFWGHVQFDGFAEDSVIVHSQSSGENFGQHEVSPNIVTQTQANYNPTSTDGENFTRISNAYHELIVDGKAIVPHDRQSPNFTAFGASAYNKAWGGIGATAITGRVQDLYYDGTQNVIPSGYTNAGANKTCGGFFAARRNAPYSQGHRGTSYSIALEAQMINAPANLNTYQLITGTDEYYGNADNLLGLWDTWTNSLHLVGGGRRPINAGIFINGYAQTYYKNTPNEFVLRNGMYNGIIIGASAMQIRGGVPDGTDENGDKVYTKGNSHETVGINTANWSQAKHGFYLLKHGYSGRVLKSASSALVEIPSLKFLNPEGSMPAALSAMQQQVTVDGNTTIQGGVVYLDFKTGDPSAFYEDPSASRPVPKERPDDITRARIGYTPAVNTSNSLFTISNSGNIKLTVGRDFIGVNEPPPTTDYVMLPTALYPSEPVNLGGAEHFWDNIFSRKGEINIADSELFKSATTIIESGTETEEKTKLLEAWGSVKVKMYQYKTSTKKHIGFIAQDIENAFAAQGLDANDYGLFWKYTDSQDNTTYGVRYNECLALEIAYLRDKLSRLEQSEE